MIRVFGERTNEFVLSIDIMEDDTFMDQQIVSLVFVTDAYLN